MQRMNRRGLLAFALLPVLLGPAALAAPTPSFQPTAQDQAELASIQTYLDSLRALKARFLQVAPNGAVTQGTAWLERPGRMRFEYDPPTPYLLVAGHGLLTFYDSQLQQTSTIPLSRTPLGMLLANHVRLSGPVTVTGMRNLPGQIQVTLVRTASPGEGSLTLIFATKPLALRQWTVVDAQRRETLVTLYNVQEGGTFKPGLFDFVDPSFMHPPQPSG